MHLIDWLGVIIPLIAVFGIAFYTKRFVKGVADFLAGGRAAGRYLLANARGASDAGLTNALARFEMVLISGLVLNFWDLVSMPVILLVGISGFVIYRFRETRALTMAQFLETRYSQAYRIYMGALAFVSGILNYGVFPAIASRFFVFFLDLPLTVAGIPTHILIMAVYLTVALIILLVGGQVTLMVADCVEGIFSHLVYMILVVVVFMLVRWDQMVEVLANVQAGPGYSMIDPFDAGKVKDFNFGFAVMNTIFMVYNSLILQNRQGFNAAARSPHEARMGGVLGNWRMYARTLITVALGIAAVTFLKHSDFANAARPALDAVKSIPDSYLQTQMSVPIALRYMLPIGVKGLFVCIMIMGLLASDAAHMHSWGTIFVQDVLLPLRKGKPLSPKSHILVLKVAMSSVALFALIFSIYWPQSQPIMLWWAITGGVFTAGAFAAVVGGLYWSRGTATGAWVSSITGSTLAFMGIFFLGNVAYYPKIAAFINSSFGTSLAAKFPYNYQQTVFAVAMLTLLTYAVVSLITCRKPYDLDKLLYRGAYADEKSAAARVKAVGWGERLSLSNLLRFDKNFSKSDKWVTAGIFIWSMAMLAINIVITCWNLFFERWPLLWWDRYSLVVSIGVPFIVALGSLFWFGIGGIMDTKKFFIALRAMKRDDADDGRVVENTTTPKA